MGTGKLLTAVLHTPALAGSSAVHSRSQHRHSGHTVVSIPVPRVTVDMVSQWCPSTRDTGCVCSLAASGREAVIVQHPMYWLGNAQLLWGDSPQPQCRGCRARKGQVWARVGRSRQWVLAWQHRKPGQWCYCVPGCSPITNLPLVSLSCLPYHPLLCLNNPSLFTRSVCVRGLRTAACRPGTSAFLLSSPPSLCSRRPPVV